MLIHVSQREIGLKLLAFLKEKKPDSISIKAIKRLIDTGFCLVNGKIERISTRLLKKGDLIEISWKETVKAPAPQAPQLKKIPVILYEDEYILICNKPPGIVCDHEFNYFSGCRLIHRLDKDTSGLLLLAKNDLAFHAMVDLFKKHQINKFYLAVVLGEVKEMSGIITSFLSKKNSEGGIAKWGSGTQENGKEAITKFNCLAKGNGASLLEISIITGRTHQIRVHFSEKGHPVLGDHLYSKIPHMRIRPPRQLLHAYKISFLHPFLQKKISLMAEIPNDFRQSAWELQYKDVLKSL